MGTTMANDYYKVLDVERTASTEEISKAYRKLARKFHPTLIQMTRTPRSGFKKFSKHTIA